MNCLNSNLTPASAANHFFLCILKSRFTLTQIVGYPDSVFVMFVFCRKVNWSLVVPKQNTSSKNSFRENNFSLSLETVTGYKSRLTGDYAHKSMHPRAYIYIYVCVCVFVPGSSVGIATELRAGRSGIEFRWGRDFPPVQTGPGDHPASCKMGTGSFPRVKCGRGVLLTTHPLLVPRSWKNIAILLPTLWATQRL